MNRFADFGIKPTEEKNMFQVPLISIFDLMNQEIKVLDFASGVQTKHGSNRYVVKIEFEERERKFFTNSSKIKDVLNQIPKENFPFLTTIKQQSFGNVRTYHFS